MKTIFQTTIGIERQDHETMEEAFAVCERVNKGLIVEFRLEPNAPFCLPVEVARSTAAWKYENGSLIRVNIHG